MKPTAPITDGRSKASKRFKRIETDILRLARDHPHPEVVAQLARTFAGLILQQEKYLKKLLNGQPMNSAGYVRLVNCSTRCLKNLGLLPMGNGSDPGDGMDTLERYIAKKTGRNGTKPDRRRERLVR